ncbi:UNVERIFIED_CONTAM: hypothetical protein HDU68_009373 [Siphonaria sp. JEL0065]|nr:hypothetical protein HDU68_009373 [Siphonaria sp. JEL0065]
MKHDVPTTQLLFVGLGGYVIALDSQTGAQIWDATLKGTGFGMPTLVIPNPIESTLLVTCGANLRCLSAETGFEIWENRLEGIGIGYPAMAQGRDPTRFNHNTFTRDPLPKAPNYSASKFDPEDYVFVASNFVVRAVSLQTGNNIWSHSTPMLEGYSSKPFLLIENGILFVAGNGRVYALNALTGQEIWKADVIHRQICTLATMASGNATENIPYNRHHVSSAAKPPLTDAIYFGTNGYINALSKQTGQVYIPGEITLHGVGINSSDMIPLAKSDAALVSAGINLRLVDLKTGKMVWENKLTGMGLGVLSLLAGSGVSLGNSNNQVNNDELPGYSAIASSSDAGPSSGPIAQDSLARVLYVSLNGQVRAIQMKDGKELWKYKPPFMNKILFPNIFVEDGRVFAAGSGIVTCFRWSHWSSGKNEICYSKLVY